MTAATVESPHAVSVEVGRWQVDGAAAATLVVASRQRLTEPLPILATAVASSDEPVRKVALAHPCDVPQVHAEYVFAQAVSRAGRSVLDLTPECGHSMIATAAHLYSRTPPAARDGVVRLLARRGRHERVVTCQLSELDRAAQRYRVDLSYPLEPVHQSFPLGRDPITLDLDGRALAVTVVDAGNPYALVDARAVGITDAVGLHLSGDTERAMLLQVRARLAPLLGLGGSSVLPKPALLLRTASGELHARAISVDDWHPGLALTGLVAIAALEVADTSTETDLAVHHLAGVSTVAVRAEATGGWTLVFADRHVRRLARPDAAS